MQKCLTHVFVIVFVANTVDFESTTLLSCLSVVGSESLSTVFTRLTRQQWRIHEGVLSWAQQDGGSTIVSVGIFVQHRSPLSGDP